jgi:Fe-Mn family superoxide dismutase
MTTQEIDRRDLFKTGAAAAAAGLAFAGAMGATGNARAHDGEHGGSHLRAKCFDEKGNAILPALEYPYESLEPHIDEQTMRLHHDKHHAGYVAGYNKALEALAHARDTGDFSLVDLYSRKLAFHGGGHILHSIFWDVMAPNAGGKPEGDLAAAIDRDFGSFEKFQAHFSAAAGSVEGSGWGVLSVNTASGRLVVHQVMNQQNLSFWATAPILPLDVWEHAYYLRYQNKRADYVQAFWNVVNWTHVAEYYANAMGGAK